MNNNPVHVCATCRFTKKLIVLGTPMESDDIEVYRTVFNMLTNAEQATSPTSIPQNTPRDIAAAYFEGAIANMAKARGMFDSWWREMRAKHPELAGLDGVRYDPDADVFTQCVDAAGVASINGMWEQREGVSEKKIEVESYKA